MTGIGTQILRTVQELQAANPDSIARQVGVTEGWVREICQNMAADGYLDVQSDGTFMLTEKGTQKLSRVKSKGLIPVLKGGI